MSIFHSGAPYLTLVLAFVATMYVCMFFVRICKLVWQQGAIGEVVDLDDVARMFGRDLWKLFTLPAVIVKAARKK